MTTDYSPVKFMAETDGKIYLRVPWTVPNFVCENCNHTWEKPDNVIVGD